MLLHLPSELSKLFSYLISRQSYLTELFRLTELFSTEPSNTEPSNIEVIVQAEDC